MTPRQIFRFAVFGLALPLAGCSTRPAAPPPPEGPPPADYRLIMGELAIARDQHTVATGEYLEAAGRLKDPGVARRATLVALLAGDRAAAGAAADRWEKLAPDDLEAAQYQAILNARAGDNAAALRYLLRIADGETGAAVGANLQFITTLLAGEPNPWRSADLMADVAAMRPEHPEGWHGAALLALQADRPAQAIEFSTRALALDPNHLDAMFVKARAQLIAWPSRSGDDFLAPLTGFRNARDSGLRYRFAGLLVLAGRDAEADALFEDILVSTPDQHDARMARALLAFDAGHLETAEAELHALLQRHGRVQDALYYLGSLAEKRGALNEAVDWYARVSPEVDRWVDAQLAIARVLLQVDGPPAAQAFFAELRARWPEQGEVLALNEAALLTGTGYAGRSLALLEQMTPTEVNRHEFDWQLALAAAETGRLARAEEVFRRLLEDDPGNPALQNALGYLLLGRGVRLDEAEALLESARAAAPANAAFLDSLGWLRYRQGKPADARPLLEESWQRQPTPGTARHLLTVLHELGDMDAVFDLREAIESRFPGAFAASTENEDIS